MAGYYGFSMSNNAVEAYKNGEMPLSKWTKKAILEEAEKYDLQCSLEKLKRIPLAVLRDKLLYESSWHHTSKFYNETNFYSFDVDEMSEITDDQLDQWMETFSRKKKAVASEERWKCSFLEWSGTRKHPHAERVVDTGTIRGNWFYRDHGRKKSIDANGFIKVERLSEKEKEYFTENKKSLSDVKKLVSEKKPMMTGGKQKMKDKGR